MQTLAPASNAGLAQVASRFAGVDALTVRQRKNWLEILLSFETRNRYEVFDAGTAALRVEEQGSGVLSLLKRLVLGPLRPFTALVHDASSGDVLLQLRRPFRFYFHRLEVHAGDGERLGAVQRRWTWIRRRYTVEDAAGREVLELFGPLLRPWSFDVREHGRAAGLIRKRWSGFGREMFTDADNFGVELAGLAEPSSRALAFAATVLIDVVHFERAKG